MQEAVQTKATRAKKTRSLTSLDWRRTILVTLPFMGALTFWQAYDGLIPLMLKNTFGLGDTATGFFMALDNILALFMLPLTGYLSDKLDTKWGRRTPFIVVGSLIAALLIPMIAIANTWKNLPLFMAVLVLTLLALSTYRAPSVALMPDVTPRPVRSKADAFNSLMAAVGGVFILVAISVLVPAVDNPDYRPVYFVISGMVILTTIIFVVCFNEPKEVAAMHRESAELGIPEEEIDASDEGGKERETDPPIRRSLLCVLVCVFLYFMSQNAISSGFSRYADAVWGMQGGSYAMVQTAATLAALVAYMPMASVACHIGRKRTTYIGLVFMVVGCVLISLSTTFSPVVYLWTILFGIGTATVSLTIYPMIVELASTQTTGRYTGYYYTASMAAQVITPILSGAVMQFVGYAQLYLYGATFAALAIVPVLFVRHGDTLTMGDVRERQASWEAEHTEASA
ncbi:MAG: MFS transporter [Parolsenella sp.]|uniref:MFS transporter n=1 Tax=Parolsenella sp. TaxID=2083006 RepID=UPI002E79A360|nr:MFS transporter [Parolsenella sp.]MEE1372267.1 MFS transporter [Parolsenella sp.]